MLWPKRKEAAEGEEDTCLAKVRAEMKAAKEEEEDLETTLVGKRRGNEADYETVSGRRKEGGREGRVAD